VRDGLVYYRALKSDRSASTGASARLPAPTLPGVRVRIEIAFWINAYNAIAMKTVIDHYQ
jgi:hypothetical protein